MIWKNIEIFNAEELAEFEDGISRLLVPRNACEILEKPAGKSQQTAYKRGPMLFAFYLL